MAVLFKGVYFDITKLIGERFLFAGIDNVKFEPEILEEGKVSNFFTGEYFKKAHAEMLEKHGLINRQTGYPNVLIPISISEDEAAMNSTRNKNEEILVMNIMNLFNGDSKIDLLGFSPKVPLADSKLHEYLLKDMHCKSATMRKNIISLTKREIHFKYLEECLKPILNSNSGYSMQVGCNKSAYKVHAFIKISFFCGDNKSLDDLFSVKSKGEVFRCINV